MIWNNEEYTEIEDKPYKPVVGKLIYTESFEFNAAHLEGQ